MFGIGMPEMLLIMAVALIVIGPKKLPDLAKTLGRAFGEFRKATSDLKESVGLNGEISELKNVKKSFDGLNTDIKDSFYAQTESQPSTADKSSGETDDPQAPVDPPTEPSPEEKTMEADDTPDTEKQKSPPPAGDQ